VTEPRQPGWYDDPGGDVGLLRWWDGGAWTGITRTRMPYERPAVPPPQPEVAWSTSEVLDADERPIQSRRTWLAVLAIVGVIGVLVLTGALPGLDSSTDGPTSPSNRAVPLPTDETPFEPPGFPTPSQAPSREPRPVSGRIVDPAAGLSYDVLPGQWRSWDMFTLEGTLTTAGYYRVLQEDTPGNGEYWANVTSGLVSPATASRDDLVATAGRLVDRLDTSYYPRHTRRDVEQRAITVDGRPGYLVSYLAVFDQTASSGYEAKSERVSVLLVNTGRQLPAALYISLPDTVRSSWGAVDALVASVRIVR
jgi:Protein of unknown function (DUF2510)